MKQKKDHEDNESEQIDADDDNESEMTTYMTEWVELSKTSSAIMG